MCFFSVGAISLASISLEFLHWILVFPNSIILLTEWRDPAFNNYYHLCLNVMLSTMFSKKCARGIELIRKSERSCSALERREKYTGRDREVLREGIWKGKEVSKNLETSRFRCNRFCQGGDEQVFASGSSVEA